MNNQIKSQFHTVSVRTFVETYTPSKTLFLDSIQRGDVWKKSNKEGFKKAILENMTPTPIILSDIESSMKEAQFRGDSQEFNQLKKWFDKGFRFLSNDGGNRTRYMNEEYDELNGNFKDLSEEKSRFFSHLIQVAVYYNLTIPEMHEMAIRTNLGVPWNKAEKRNALMGIIPQLVRDCVSKTKNIFEQFLSSFEMNRMKPDEMIGYFLYYFLNRPDGMNQKNLDSLYAKNTIERKEEFEKILSDWKKILGFILKDDNQVSKPLASNLFFFLVEMKNKGYLFNQDMSQEFSSIYVQKEEERLVRTFDSETKKSAWRNLARYSKNYHLKVQTIMNDLNDEIETYFVQKDKTRTFTPEDKIEKMIKSESLITNLDGTTNKITILQALNGKKFHGDHIIPHSKGGKTNVGNLQILSQKENLLKSDKV